MSAHICFGDSAIYGPMVHRLVKHCIDVFKNSPCADIVKICRRKLSIMAQFSLNPTIFAIFDKIRQFISIQEITCFTLQ